MSSVRTYSGLVYAMDDLRRAWRQRHLLEAALLIVAAVLGLLVLVVATDNLLSLGVGGRFLGLLVVLGSGGMLILGLFVKRCLEQRRDDYFAALCEKQFPELDNRLINGLQLGRGTEPGSPQIIDAIVDEAHSAAIDLDLTDSLDWQPVRRAALSGLGVMLVLCLYAGFGSNHSAMVFRESCCRSPTLNRARRPGSSRNRSVRRPTATVTPRGWRSSSPSILRGFYRPRPS